MRKFVVPCAVCILASGCGGGGGSTPQSVSATPPPANTDITNLSRSQSFVNDASRTDVTFNLTSSTSISAQGRNTALTISYDAASKSYTIASGDVSDVFSPADLQSTAQAEGARYKRSSGGTSSYLTLVTTPLTSSTPNRYVGLGYYQRNAIANENQVTAFLAFAYGLDTPASGVPRAGSGFFKTNVFGLADFPGKEPVSFQGAGRFDVDFVNGLFSTATFLDETTLVSGDGRSGGGIRLTGGGRLSASNGTFSGDVVYGSGFGSGLPISGQLAGRFFGPNGEEIGASFSGSRSDGSAFNGALTGQRDSTTTPENISFAGLTKEQYFVAPTTVLEVRTATPQGVTVRGDLGGLGVASSNSQVTDMTSGNVRLSPPSSGYPGGTFTVASIVPGDSNFTSYAQTIGDRPTRLELYKTGKDNHELALTYASFGRFTALMAPGSNDKGLDSLYFDYGFATPVGVFNNRTGSASYAGPAYATGADLDGKIYDVTGSAKFAVDFTSQTVTGSLALAGTAGAERVDFGAFDASGALKTNASAAALQLQRTGGRTNGSMQIDFYGPSGEEAAGIFEVKVPDGVAAGTLINGALVAKRQ